MALRSVYVAIALITLAVFSGCSRTPAPQATPPFAVSATPTAVYEVILPEIRDRIARDTKIVRIDGGDGTVTMRFTAYLEDHSVRLVEVRLVPDRNSAGSLVALNSRRFSFLPGRSRDLHDLTLESSLAELIRRRITPPRS